MFRFRLLPVTVLIAACAGVPFIASAATLNTLYSFCKKSNCTDGQLPISKLLMDDGGNLYGETEAGGEDNHGTVFMLERDTGTPKYKVLYSFCPNHDCGVSGYGPYDVSGLIMDTAGNLYGTTSAGGGRDTGTAFELMPNDKHTKWKFKQLYSFCLKAVCADGAEPLGGLTYAGQSSGARYDGTSPLYGMTEGGGSAGGGTVYSLTPLPGKAGKFKHSVLYGFCAQTNCSDGNQPNWGLTVTADGNAFYGITHRGGANGGNGVLFALTRKGTHWKETVLHTFCASDPCTDGLFPTDLIADPESGVLYGTTQLSALSGGGGTMFSYDPASKQFTTTHTFCTSPPCSDGQAPAGITLDPSGVLYGSTGGGGDYSWGTVFSANTNGSGEQPLYSFCSDVGNSNCADGRIPFPATVTSDGAGHLFGTTNSGGVHSSAGTLFELTP